MSVQPTYPGVYVQEIPSGVRTIVGVATSITAFIGSALKGPANQPVTINSYSDFERTFGGLWVKSMMGYAVKDFYLNGGSQAIIVRIENGATPSTINLPTLGSPVGALSLRAASNGVWGNKLKASVNYQTKDADSAVPDNRLFNLIVFEDTDGGVKETFLNVSTNANDPRFVTRVLLQSSVLVRVNGVVPVARPIASVPLNPPGSGFTSVAAAGGSDGIDLTSLQYLGSEVNKTGIYALKNVDLFNLLSIPPAVRGGDTDIQVYKQAMKLCVAKRAILLVDSPAAWEANAANAPANAIAGLGALGLNGPDSRNAALYFPRVKLSDQLRDGQTDVFVPSGIIAGVIARTDTTRGAWKSPAGIDASLNGVQGVNVALSDEENGQLNPLGINVLRNFPIVGSVVWGARTLRGADQLADDYKYIAVRRTALLIEESLYRGTQWVVFEPNDEPLWAQIRLNVGAFMHNLFRQGAFQGTTPKDAYLVKCDKETTTQNDINLGIVNILVGFAPLKPAEFVFIKIQQLTGQIDT
jgi:phage tail sheath protein FI